MADAPVVRSVSPVELLRERERVWRARLSGDRVGLVAEDVKTESKHAEQALHWLGRLWLSKDADPRFLRRFPAVHVQTTTRIATDHYAAKFWPLLCEYAGIPLSASLQSEWGRAYIDNLRWLGLPTFSDHEDSGSTYVGPILMHSGVPTYCLPDFFRLIRDRRRLDPHLTPEKFVQWAAERVERGRLRSVDKPVQRFLRYGGEFAVDVTERVYELLDLIATGGNGEAAELPPRFQEVAQKMRDQGELTKPTIRSSTQSSDDALGAAVLMLDPYGRGPFVRLPSVPDADEGQVVWIVGADSEELRASSPTLLAGYREPAPQVDVPISRPVRQVTARLEGSQSLNITIPVVDSDHPTLIFDESGAQVSLTAPIRQDAIWVIHPAGTGPTSPNPDQIRARAELPPGWDGWALHLLDLREATTLTLADGTVLPVNAKAVPRIVLSEPVEGAHTMAGEPVFASLPSIQLPDAAGDGPAWHVSLTDHTGKELSRFEASSTQDCEGRWGDLTDLCGEVRLRVRGPWGRAVSRRFTVVQGLQVRSDPPWRRMLERGLQPCVVQLAATPGVRVSDPSFELAGTQVRRRVAVATGPERLLLIVEPPHMSVSHISAAGVGQESINALRLYAEKLLEDPGVLVITTRAAADPTLYVHGRQGFVQAVVARSVGQGSVHRFPLAEITDTLRAERQLRLTLDPEGSLTVANVRPERLFSGMSVVAGKLQLSDAPDIDGLSAVCYRALAPWASPSVLPVSKGVANLPEDLNEAGPLLVQVRVEDPWAPEPVPVWPEAYRRVEQPGYPREADEASVALSAYLAGEVAGVADNFELELVWIAFDRLWQLGLGKRADRLDQELRTLLLARPADALVALARSTIEPERVPLLLARSGLMSSGVRPDAGEAQLALRRANVLPLAMLGWHSQNEDRLDALAGVCGDVVRELAEGRDPVSNVGGFDATSDFLASKTPAEREVILRSAGIVPTGLLDANSRALAANALLSLLDDAKLSWLRSNARRYNDEIRATLRAIDAPFALAAMEARRHPRHPSGWRALPEWSIGIAFACRAGAHLGLELPVVSDCARSVSSLAVVAPTLVTIDLLIAELLCRYHLAGRTLGA